MWQQLRPGGRFLMLLAVIATGACTGADEAGTPELKPSTVLRGNGGDPETLDPALAEDVHTFNVLTDIYEGLVSTASDGSLVPGVAESWQLSDDGLDYTFYLRTDARWSNGEPVVAADFVRAFGRVSSPDTQSAYGFLLNAVQSYAAADDHTLTITLSSPTSYFLEVLAMPIAFPVNKRNVSEDSGTGFRQVIGNGPYALTERVIGGPARLRRNSHYWDAESVHIDNIEYLPITDALSELNMYRAGELDITNTMPPNYLAMLRGQHPGQVRIAPSLGLYYLAFDLSEPPFNNLALRKALTMAINREQLVALIGRGEQAAYGIVPPGVSNYGNNRFDWHSLSADAREAKARDLYQRSGYMAGNHLQMTLVYDTGDIHERVALAVSDMWRQVLGVETSLDKREWQYFLETRDNRAQWQVMRFAWSGDYNDASTFTDIFRSDSPQNLPLYRNETYDELLDMAAAEMHSERRTELLRNAESQLLDDYPIAPLYFFVSKHLVKPHIEGFEDNVLDRHPSKYLRLRGEDAKQQ